VRSSSPGSTNCPAHRGRLQARRVDGDSIFAGTAGSSDGELPLQDFMQFVSSSLQLDLVMFSSTYCWILRWILHIGQSERGEGHRTVWDASNVVDCSMHCLGFGGLYAVFLW
jgi:hypothetical protein